MSAKDREPDDTMALECELDASPEKVWRALTIPELAERWLDLGDGEAAPSYAIVEALPHSRVRYAWSDPAADEAETVVTIDLTPLPEGRTRFRLTHGVEARTVVAANTNSRPAMALAA